MSSFQSAPVSWKAGSSGLLNCGKHYRAVSDSFPRVAASKSKDNYKGAENGQKLFERIRFSQKVEV